MTDTEENNIIRSSLVLFYSLADSNEAAFSTILLVYLFTYSTLLKAPHDVDIGKRRRNYSTHDNKIKVGN